MFAEVLRERTKGIADLSDAQIETLRKHFELMVRWNRTVNLTRITDLREAVERHYVESLLLGAQLPVGSLKIVDVGSGAGFPGLPVAVLRSDCEVTLVESHARKAVFLREATRSLPNIVVRSQRAESVKERFGWLISRALSYEDLTGSIRSLAPQMALLTGNEAPPKDWSFKWQEPMRVPGGEMRFLRIACAPS